MSEGDSQVRVPKGRKRKKYRRKKDGFLEPITSYGLMAYSRQQSKIYFLLYQRRDNFEYMDFIRGLWATPDDLPLLFSAMSIEERKRIRNFTFAELWEDLWVEHSSRIFVDGYPKAKRKYDSVKDQISSLLSSTTSVIKEPPWGFPKGKKNNFKETAIACALREFEEETRLPTHSVIIDKEFSPFIETFRGSDGKFYSTHYYLAEFPEMHLPSRMETPHCIRDETISEEASNVRWFSYEEACVVLNEQRIEFVREAMMYLS